ncbi:IS5 family transposase [Akkermansiaceae bacterium]|nr:IS5 family transposase [Akkermansiaceae bacterium]
MDHQPGFSELEYAGKRKQTRREKFLASMEEIVPWEEILRALKPYYPEGKRGRPPIGLERMLRLYFLQQWYGLADEALEDAVYDSQALRAFLGINLSCDPVPDATTLLKFRHLLEENDLCATIFETINAHLEERGMLMREGTLVDATIINAPSSTKNKDKSRDPEMHQTKKGNEWYFGMKAHIGADRDSGMVHTVISTAANVSDISQTADLLHGSETQVHADAGYVGVQKREEIKTEDPTGRIDWQIARRRSPIKKMEDGPEKDGILAVEKAKASVRAFVEHPFHLLKNIFGHRKTRYRGLAKNHHQLQVIFGLGNLVLASRQIA